MDSILCRVADALENDDEVEKLGKKLGFRIPQINRYLRSNRAGELESTRGTKGMLREWAMGTSGPLQRSELRTALLACGLVQIADAYLPETVPVNTQENLGELQSRSLTPEEIQRCKNDLKRYYCQEFGEIQTSPLDPHTMTELDRLYTNLLLMFGNDKANRRSIDYESFLRRVTDPQQKARIALVGEAGVGKTTFLAKIALDWAKGRCLQDISLLLLVLLKESEKCKHFGDIIMKNLSDEFEFEGERIDEYIRTHQDNAVLLLDGLDEYDGEIHTADHLDAVVKSLRGEKFKRAPVLVTMRPWKAEEMRNVKKFNKLYTFISIEGFRKEDVDQYIGKFFANDVVAARSLIYRVKRDSLIAESLAPYPIFCNMLCHMWRDESKRETVQKLRTFSQVMGEMVFLLQEHYASKVMESGSGDSFHGCITRSKDSCARVGEVAFQGLLNKQLAFGEEAFNDCSDELEVVCTLGVLIKEKKLAPKCKRKEGQQHVIEVRFPHNLLQEYLSGVYFASLYLEDPVKLEHLLTTVVLQDYNRFRYLLYFTTAQGKDVGRVLMASLCSSVDDDDFIFDVSFECYDQDAIEPAVDHLRSREDLFIGEFGMTAHTKSGYLFTLEACSRMMANKSTSFADRGAQDPDSTDPDSVRSPVTALFSLLPNLRMLNLVDLKLERFYPIMASVASRSKIEHLLHANTELDSLASGAYARGVFSMPNLRYLQLSNVQLSDAFYLAMPKLTTHTQIQDLIHSSTCLGPDASRAYATAIFSMTTLKSLDLAHVTLDTTFFLVMADLSSVSQIEHFSHTSANLGAEASSAYAKAVFTMPLLESLEMISVELTSESFPELSAFSSRSLIKTLVIQDVSMTRHTLTTFLSLPALQSLTLESITCHYASHDAATFPEHTSLSPSVVELKIDGPSLCCLTRLGLQGLCPYVEKITLECADEVTSDSIRCLGFHRLKDLELFCGSYNEATIFDAKSFCEALLGACPQIDTLSINYLTFSDSTAAEILQSIQTHEHLKTMTLTRWKQDAALDAICAEINKEGKMSITIKHGYVVERAGADDEDAI